MEKFISPEKPPEGLEREMLEILIEECAEVQQRVCKILRFGLTEIEPGQDKNNTERLSLEVGDLMEVIIQCKNMGLVDSSITGPQMIKKRNKLKIFLQNS